MNDRYVVSFECNETAKENLVKLLEYFEMMSDLGGTRDFVIDNKCFVFDGDGPDRLTNIKVKEVEQ